jgi:hypothetical protein
VLELETLGKTLLIGTNGRMIVHIPVCFAIRSTGSLLGGVGALKIRASIRVSSTGLNQRRQAVRVATTKLTRGIAAY